eukprot:TRINITY_DN16545_c2_g6_i1.p1 TRINITY_DN16545_c2_g6~~TRINITY_DN16545_c2_g6_i1.p1  ORF type:complete len:520 (+),score=95.27 TRINITY_DN16545_c2_g6_i1:74-1561(+)
MFAAPPPSVRLQQSGPFPPSMPQDGDFDDPWAVRDPLMPAPAPVQAQAATAPVYPHHPPATLQHLSQVQAAPAPAHAQHPPVQLQFSQTQAQHAPAQAPDPLQLRDPWEAGGNAADLGSRQAPPHPWPAIDPWESTPPPDMIVPPAGPPMPRSAMPNPSLSGAGQGPAFPGHGVHDPTMANPALQGQTNMDERIPSLAVSHPEMPGKSVPCLVTTDPAPMPQPPTSSPAVVSSGIPAPAMPSANSAVQAPTQGAIRPNFVPNLRLPQPAATAEAGPGVVGTPAAPHDTADEDSMGDFPAPKNQSETDSELSQRQQRPCLEQQPAPPREAESPPLDAAALPLGVHRRYFVFHMMRKRLDEKLGISFQEVVGVDAGMEVTKIIDTIEDAGKASGKLLAAQWNEAMHATFPENALQPGDVAYKLQDGSPFNKDAIYSVLPNTLDIWIVFYREEGPSFSFTIPEDAPGRLIKAKDLEVSVAVPASRKAGDVWRVLGAHA